jgi:hypothetical protein
MAALGCALCVKKMRLTLKEPEQIDIKEVGALVIALKFLPSFLPSFFHSFFLSLSFFPSLPPSL